MEKSKESGKMRYEVEDRVKLKNREKIDKMLEGLEIPMEFGTNDDGYFNDRDWIEDHIYEQLGAISHDIDTGASKLVIIFDELDEVVKIPFNGVFELNCSYEEDCAGECSDCESFIENEWANDIDELSSDWNYCENELIKYERAKELGFGDFYAKMEKYGEVGGHPVYLQEKVVPLFFSNSLDLTPPSENAKSVYKSQVPNRGRLPKGWLLHAIDYFGAERVIDFLNFLIYNNFDDDLHTGNVGFTKDKRPVLLDWAGWRN